MKEKTISGFSKLSKRRKIKWIVETFFKDPEAVMHELMSYWHKSEDQQRILDGFSENTISNFMMPYGVAPNFQINGKSYVVPMVIEESSVVAAAAAAAKFWMTRGGFKTEVLGTIKIGQLHFKWAGSGQLLRDKFDALQAAFLKGAESITKNMRSRGGGISGFELLDLTTEEDQLFQVRVSFETCDSMGANFINSCLEQFAKTLELFILEDNDFQDKEIEIIMCILSNYTPGCVVRALVECPISELGNFAGDMSAETFAQKFKTAVKIAHIDPYRATTHNKGIFNGIDAVVIATGNDFRAIEACGHSYASRDGQYRSLSACSVDNDMFKFWLDIPLAIGTVGGLTSLHPIAKRSLELLGNPDAKELMQIIAATGLAQNFAALRSLVTTGIQQGHMKMHLQNILNQLGADEVERKKVETHFSDRIISFSDVSRYLKKIKSSPIT